MSTWIHSILTKNFMEACLLLRGPLVTYLRSHCPLPTYIISSTIRYWTKDVARKFDIPSFVFYGYGCFPLLCFHNIHTHELDKKIKDVNEPFTIPGMPDSIEITRAQAPRSFAHPSMVEYLEKINPVESTSDGLVVNTFDALEPLYPEWCEKAIGKKVWTIGPLSLFNKGVFDMASRRDKASIDEDKCLKWLDSKEPSSVVYVSFGSITRTIPSLLIKIGLGLEASNCSFIWVIKAGEKLSEVEEWLSEFEERTRDRGLIIKGWAPQVLILSHPDIGGFMTHCGWNLMLEAVAFGVPLITWPHFGDQFLNEKLIVNILRSGIAVGVKTSTKWGVEAINVLVGKGDVETAIQRLFDRGEEAEEQRKRVRELKETARKAVEAGGSSDTNISQFIQYIFDKRD